MTATQEAVEQAVAALEEAAAKFGELGLTDWQERCQNEADELAAVLI